MMMMYDPTLVQPMRDDLVKLGFTELRNPAEVDAALGDKSQPVFLVVNSVCGCAAGTARPGVALALKESRPAAKLVTVFAGQEREAVAQARTWLKGYAPSSPSMALLRNGEVLFMLERHQIEGRTADAIGKTLAEAFAKHLGSV